MIRQHRYLFGSGFITLGVAIAVDGFVRSVLITVLVIAGVAMLATDA